MQLHCRGTAGGGGHARMTAEGLLLIAGRSSRQGTALNKGKLKSEYIEVTSALEMHPADMERLQLHDGDSVRLSNEIGSSVVKCRAAKPDEIPQGVMFIAYGPPSSQLMDADTAGSGMPISKNIRVRVEPL
jgi:formylmethanofuran dehydrogenase subunit D